MPDDERRRRRPSLRLPQYDYGQPGGYFVTICTKDRILRFGSVEDGGVRLSPPGEMVKRLWDELADRFPHISLDEFVVMPNHVHGIILINEQRPGIVLGQIIGTFKSLTTRDYSAGVRRAGWDPFAGRLWQDNYFEHLIRDDAALYRIREYIRTNPVRWDLDPEHPSRRHPADRSSVKQSGHRW